MPLLSLSDDVLLLIFSLFRGREALPSSLTCKRVYPLAMARVASLAACKSPAQLRRLCEYYLSSDVVTGEPRAKYLEDLHIHAATFKQEPNGAEPVPVHLIAELLSHAHNIRRLALDEFIAALKAEPKISLALSSVQRLEQIQLSMVADHVLNGLQRIGNPKRLTLASFVYDEGWADGGHSIPSLLTPLAVFPNLHTLMLWEFKPWPLDSDAPAFPPLPAVRYLLLSWASPYAISIIEHCPNLSTLVFSGDFDFMDDTESVGPRWRPLRRLMLAEPRDGVCVVDRLGTVRLFELSGGFDVAAPTVDSTFLQLLRLASPVGLYFGLQVYRCQWALPSSFWMDFPSAVPTLRSLELKLDWSFPCWSGQDYEQLLRQLLEMLGHIPLLVLKILSPQTAVPSRTFAGRKVNPDMYKMELAEAKTREKERVQAVAELPQPFVDAIPSLRYFSLADMAPNPALADDADASESSDESNTDDAENGRDPEHWKWDALHEIAPIKQMWWKIVEEGGQRVMVEISADEGERVKREVELQDDEEMLEIEENTKYQLAASV